jgi:putative intracellular protease/amidase
MQRSCRFLSVLLLLLQGAAHAAPLSDQPERVLIVVTNHAELGKTGASTGYFLSEVAHPWKVFKEAGFAVDFASPTGGYAPMDPKSFDLEDPINREFWHDLDAVESVVATQSLGNIDPSNYAAIFFAGGHGTMWDFPSSTIVADKITHLYRQGGVVGAVCHGPAAFVDVRMDGRPLVEGRRIAAFTNAEEDAVQLTEAMPFLLESKLREQGAEFVGAENFSANVVVDGRLVTGQNPASATGAAEAIVRILEN